MEAASVFYDEESVIFDDPDHSVEEERFLIIGFSKSARLLTVVYCLRNSESNIRIISARKAAGKEALDYQQIKKGWQS